MQNNDFNQWNDLKIETNKSISIIKIKEGEIRWCRFGINIGNETLGKGDSFRRPVLILKKYSGDVFLGLPLTSKIKQGNWYFSLNVNGATQSIILNQGRVMDRKRLEDKILEISRSQLVAISGAYCNLIIAY